MLGYARFATLSPVSQSKKSKPKDQADDGERERLYAQVLEGFNQLLESGVEVDQLREVLKKSFMLTARPDQREEYDAIRVELDAYLRSKTEGDAAVETPEGFVPSPDVSVPTIEDLEAAARKRDDDDEPG